MAFLNIDIDAPDANHSNLHLLHKCGSILFTDNQFQKRVSAHLVEEALTVVVTRINNGVDLPGETLMRGPVASVEEWELYLREKTEEMAEELVKSLLTNFKAEICQQSKMLADNFSLSRIAIASLASKVGERRVEITDVVGALK